MIGKKVTLELRRETTVSDGIGGWTTTVEGKRHIRGVLSTITGDERVANDKVTVLQTHNFYIDFPIGLAITEEDIFRYGTRKFKIIFVNNLGASQNLRLKITLKEEV